MSKEIIIFGTGGHAKVVFDILLKEGLFKPVAFFSMEKDLKSFLGLPHFHQDEFKVSSYTHGVIAIGDNWIRSKVVDFITSEKKNFIFISAVHPSAQVGTGANIGVGTVIMANTVVNPYTEIGNHVILNTSSSIDHDCKIKHFASIAPGAILGGNVEVGEFSAVSLGASIIHGKKIGAHSVIGAGSVVVKDIEDHVVAFGTPCRILRKRVEDEKYL